MLMIYTYFVSLSASCVSAVPVPVSFVPVSLVFLACYASSRVLLSVFKPSVLQHNTNYTVAIPLLCAAEYV